MSSDPRFPVHLLAGFLGSGKTTLLNRILTEEGQQRIAVIVNEFGDVGIDGDLVVGGDDEVIQLENGCICCTVRGDLQETLKRLLARRRGLLGLPIARMRFDRVLIEASGMASPGPAVQTLLVDSELASSYRLDGVITLAHAAHIVDQLRDHPEASEQLAYADRILLNHIDRVEDVEAAKRAVEEINPEAELLLTERAALPLQDLLAPPTRELHAPAEPPSGAHTHGVQALSFASTAPLDLDRTKMWLQFLAGRRGFELMRIKGLLHCTGHERRVEVHGIYQWLELGPGEQEAPETSQLVVIGRHLDEEELQRGWNALQEPGP